MHLTEAEINGLVQYDFGNNQFFALTKDDYEAIHGHYNSCTYCKDRYQKSKSYYDEIEQLSSPKTVSFWMYSAAAILLISLFPFMNSSDLNQDAFINYNEFGFTIHRGGEELTTELQNELTFL